jgi:hypothetical protein
LAFTRAPKPPSPEPASFRFILPRRSSSSEFLRHHHPPASFRDAGPPTQGLFPPATSPAGVHSREGCQAPASFRPQVFATSRRFPPPTGSASLFHPAAASRVSPFRGFSPRVAVLSLREPAAPLPLSPGLSPANPRLRGLPPREGALSMVRGSAAPPLAPLFGFRSSRSSTSAGALVPQSHPLAAVPTRVLHARPTSAALSVSSAAG